MSQTSHPSDDSDLLSSKNMPSIFHFGVVNVPSAVWREFSMDFQVHFVYKEQYINGKRSLDSFVFTGSLELRS